MDVKTSSGGWETMRSSVGNVVGKGAWGKGVFDDLKDITKNLEKAEEKISAKDEDGVVSFHHLDRTTTYQEIYEKMEVLYGFTNKAHDLVDETIDEKFYQEIDKYAVAMRDLTINKYSTKNITGATKQELVFTSSSMQEMQTVSKDKITVDDLFSDSSPLGKKMKAEFDQYKLTQDKEIEYKDYKQSMLNTGAFEYTSIKDKQMKKEMWVNLGIAAVIVIASIAFPPAGMALGLVVSSLEVGSAITGKDWVSGRELGTGERVFRGILGGVGLGTELYALNSFSKNVRLASQMKYGGEGATSVQHLGDMVANSGKGSYGRVTEFGNSVKLNSTDSGIIYIKNSNPRNKNVNGTIDDIIIDGSHLTDGKLKPNTKYKVGEHNYNYETNSNGVIEHASTDNLQLKTHEGRLPHNSETPDKLPGDHAGHLFGDRFGGSGELDNLVSQAQKVNLSSYKKIENTWAKAIEQGKEVTVDIIVNYDSSSLRPISFEVNYTIDGVDFYEFIHN
ncbi:MAG: DNA/RNA non-specific endonuclease [Carnobacterium sp.]|uniref:DNA/RNA non-specific endonuclease n=1 Tax=Carnobacterium sp. TaxID=48221 RepID=UPI002FCA31EE